MSTTAELIKFLRDEAVVMEIAECDTTHLVLASADRLEILESQLKIAEKAMGAAIFAKNDAEQQASTAHQKTYKEALLQNTTAAGKLLKAELRIKELEEALAKDQS
jgi:hypothetical protein